jgi:hypothetical protein
MSRFPRYVRLTLPRLWIRDTVYFGTKSMNVGGSTVLRVSAVMAARRNNQPLVSWNAILIKALALTSKKWPQLKRAYIAFPWPHLYEHPHCVATVVVEREWQGARCVFFDQIHAPESKSLRELDQELTGIKNLKIEAVGGFRRLIRITRLPLPLRRLIWLIALRGSGRLKSRYFGTFSINSLTSRHGRTTQSVSPVTVSFEYAPIQPGGDMPFQIFVDHRVMDGVTVHRLCADLQAILDGTIVDELNATPRKIA